MVAGHTPDDCMVIKLVTFLISAHFLPSALNSLILNSASDTQPHASLLGALLIGIETSPAHGEPRSSLHAKFEGASVCTKKS